MDFRKMFDDVWFRAWDLDGAEVTVVIDKVEQGKIENSKDKTSKSVPVLRLRGYARPLGLNKTNARTVAAMYSNDTTKWVGKRITIYPTTINVDGVDRDCIRIKPNRPEEVPMDELLTRDPKKGKAA